ncbi:MAG: VWA domain-containing protein [Acidobacteria bacterium]|nr:VWA domain-containing protein [Acidobacteriota bacterium]
MRFFLHLSFFIGLFTFAGSAQVPIPTPTPQDDKDIVKISTSLIQVDVSVTDAKGNPITDLRPDEVEIYENGAKQKITNFSFISAGKNSETEKSSERSKNSNILPPVAAQLKPGQIRRTIALVIDDLTLSFESFHFVRKALRNFVDNQMQDGDLVAIIRTGGGAGALQQFTNDKRLLYAAIDKAKFNPRGSGKISAFEPFLVSQGELEDLEENRDLGPRHKEESLNDFRTRVFTTGSLGALGYIVKGLKQLPGRKSIMFLSDGFKIFGTGGNGFVDSSETLERLRRLIDEANRAAVVVYSIDARGLQTLGFTAADDLGSRAAGPPGQAKPILPHRTTQILTDRANQFFDTQEGLAILAEETGGLFIRNTNDLGGGIEKILRDQSYYLIGYEPDTETFDPEKRKFNELDVRVTRPDTKVRYRSGFFGVEDEKSNEPAANISNGSRILSALVSPFAVNELDLGLSAIFKANAAKELFVDTYIHIRGDQLRFRDSASGTKEAAFDLMLISFDENGAQTGQISKTITINAKKKTYDEIIKNGFVYFAALKIKNPGAYQVRAAILDHATKKIGSASQFIEIPKLRKDRIVLSGIVVDNFSYKAWQEMSNNQGGQTQGIDKGSDDHSTAMSDTALRRFKSGTVLSYAYEIYNAGSSSDPAPQLTTKTRLFNGNELIYEGKETPLIIRSGSAVYPALGAINLAKTMGIGDYLLQVIVTGKTGGSKPQTATQFITFEIVE